MHHFEDYLCFFLDIHIQCACLAADITCFFATRLTVLCPDFFIYLIICTAYRDEPIYTYIVRDEKINAGDA